MRSVVFDDQINSECQLIMVISAAWCLASVRVRRRKVARDGCRDGEHELDVYLRSTYEQIIEHFVGR